MQNTNKNSAAENLLRQMNDPFFSAEGLKTEKKLPPLQAHDMNDALKAYAEEHEQFVEDTKDKLHNLGRSINAAKENQAKRNEDAPKLAQIEKLFDQTA